jgi:hypothetical protein
MGYRKGSVKSTGKVCTGKRKGAAKATKVRSK